MRTLAVLLIAGSVGAATACGARLASEPQTPDAPAAQPFASSLPDLILDLPADLQERRQLPNGDEYLAANGTITNVGKDVQNVPTVLVVLHDAEDRVVYSFEIEPAKRSLAPGESVEVVHAIADVPRSAKFVEIGWKPE